MFWVRAVVLTALLAAGCSSADGSSTPAPSADSTEVPIDTSVPGTSPSADAMAEPDTDAVVKAPADDVIRLTPAETAIALADPTTAEAGVWSVLANLGIGVYTGQAERVLGGSEMSEDDFWLYDFEVPVLVRMANSPPQPFAVTYARMSEAGFDGSLEDLLTTYRETYAAAPDAFLVQLFAAAGVGFETDLELTQFEEWLLVLDTVVPPNGSDVPQAARSGQPEASESGAVAARASADRMLQGQPAGYQDLCGLISYGQVTPAWGIVWATNRWAQGLLDHHFATHGLLLTSGVEATIEAESPTAHEGHGDDGTPVDFSAHVKLEYFPNPSFYVPECGSMVNMDPVFVGPLPDVEINWQPDDVLNEHGWFREGSPGAFTDAAGEARLTYVPNQEDSDGIGLEQGEPGALSGTFNMKTALLAVVVNPRFLDLVPEWMPIPEVAELEVRWHQANLRVSVYETEGPSFMEYEAWTCDGENWQASFEWSGQPGGAEILVFADFDFELPEGGGQAITPVEAIGGIQVEDVTLSMTIPYDFEFTVEEGDPFAVVGINRQPGGGVTGPVGGQVPFPATGFPEFDFVAPLEENLDCPD